MRVASAVDRALRRPSGGGQSGGVSSARIGPRRRDAAGAGARVARRARRPLEELAPLARGAAGGLHAAAGAHEKSHAAAGGPGRARRGGTGGRWRAGGRPARAGWDLRDRSGDRGGRRGSRRWRACVACVYGTLCAGGRLAGSGRPRFRPPSRPPARPPARSLARPLVCGPARPAGPPPSLPLGWPRARLLPAGPPVPVPARPLARPLACLVPSPVSCFRRARNPGRAGRGMPELRAGSGPGARPSVHVGPISTAWQRPPWRRAAAAMPRSLPERCRSLGPSPAPARESGRGRRRTSTPEGPAQAAGKRSHRALRRAIAPMRVAGTLVRPRSTRPWKISSRERRGMVWTRSSWSSGGRRSRDTNGVLSLEFGVTRIWWCPPSSSPSSTGRSPGGNRSPEPRGRGCRLASGTRGRMCTVCSVWRRTRRLPRLPPPRPRRGHRRAAVGPAHRALRRASGPALRVQRRAPGLPRARPYERDRRPGVGFFRRGFRRVPARGSGRKSAPPIWRGISNAGEGGRVSWRGLAGGGIHGLSVGSQERPGQVFGRAAGMEFFLG